jgi:hypothetical protein
MLRFVFWLTIVVAFIPVNPADLREGQRPVSAFETMRIAQVAFADIAGFCARNESACASGLQIASQIGLKARAGVEMLATAYRLASSEEATPRAGKNVTGKEIDAQRTGAIGK